jgi:hypothetical protein
MLKQEASADFLNIPAELDAHMTAILGSPDPLDSNDFEPVVFINGIFPTGSFRCPKN